MKARARMDAGFDARAPLPLQPHLLPVLNIRAGGGVLSCMRRSWFLSLLLASPLSAADAPWSITPPTAEAVRAALRPARPRLLAPREQWDQLRARLPDDPVLQAWAGTLRKQADSLLKKPPETYHIPDGKRLLFVSRSVLDRVYLLAFAWRLDGRPAHRERLWAELEAVCAFKDWNPPHFLDTAEMAHAVAVGYDWLYADWTPERRAVLRAALVRHALTPARSGRHTWYKTAHHNWNQVCNGGIGLAALAVLDEEADLAAPLLAEAIASLPLALREYAPDGAWGEGPAYWHYATSYTVAFLAGLETALGTDYGLATAPGLARTAHFPIHLTGATGEFFNFADCRRGGRGAHGPWFFWLARRFDDPLAAAFGERHPGPHPLSLLWRAPPAADPWAGTPTDAVFRYAEAAAFRSAWGDPRALYAGMKAGDNGFNHSHLDLGSFVFESDGVRWVLDIGPDNYNLPGFFGAKRWEYYRLRAEGQNTLVINPGPGPDQAPKARAVLSEFRRDAHGASVRTDLTAAYRAHARAVTRQFTREGDRAFTVTDRVDPLAPADVWWFAHTEAEVEITDAGRALWLRQKGRRLRVTLENAPADLTFQVLPAEPLPTSPHPAGQAENPGVRKITLHTRLTTPASWTVRFARVGE
jgi:hypothetical protein